jgi:hypothetical protein
MEALCSIVIRLSLLSDSLALGGCSFTFARLCYEESHLKPYYCSLLRLTSTFTFPDLTLNHATEQPIPDTSRTQFHL